MKYKIAIPSYQRENTLANKTIKILQKHNIDPNIVHIFVADHEQKQKYLKTLPEEYKSRLIINNVKGIRNVRNFINDYFKEGEYVFHMDDDLIDIYKMTTNTNIGAEKSVRGNKLEPISNLDALIKLGFSLCEEKGCKLFSIYPVENAYFMKNSIFRGLTYCMAGAMGTINRQNLKVSVNDKEDFERSLLYFLDTYNPKNPQKGGVIRFNNICAGTKGYKGAGGMQSFDRSYNVVLEAAETIVNKYGKYCSLNLKKKSGKPEVKIHQIKLEEILV